MSLMIEVSIQAWLKPTEKTEHSRGLNMSNPTNEENVQPPQLSEIQSQLSQLSSQLAEIKPYPEQISSLSEQVSQLEERLMLVSDVHRYGKLQQDLASGNWFEADKETVNVILDVAGKPIEELTPEDIRNFPCNAIATIDLLWLRYSQKRFGFSIQLGIYQTLGGNLETTLEQDRKLIEKLGERVGWRENNRWRKCDKLDYSPNAPVGCHPSRWWNSPYGSKMTNYFLARLMACDL
ncbi:GUN4 protein [Pleurocapsa sp. PCC 7327]|uniref:GUN4 domain-containing protein n=1 Tax=Pleurocapsa sp. PCC 7327 TaxID=118163 RepID=UPI00029FA3DD|nr:GUN4 protein [Pleurocapsa sp. PCC 7327]